MYGMSNLLAGQHDLQKERPPPGPPTPVTFPSLAPPDPSLAKPPASWVDDPRQGIPAHLIKLKKPSDVNLDTLALLNITFGPQCDLETIIPSLPNNRRSYLPPKSWLDPPTSEELQTPSSTSSNSPVLLNNGRKSPDRHEFYMRAKELLFKNEDAFLNLTRRNEGTKPTLRLAHFRKFWEGLDNLAYYWDTSLDEYLPPKPEAVQEGNETSPSASPTSALPNSQQPPHTGPSPPPPSNGGSTPQDGSTDALEPRKKAKTEEAVSHETTSPPPPSPSISNPENTKKPSISSSKALPARTIPPRVPWATNMPSISSSKPLDLSNGSYRGYRIGNGADMPEQYRLDCVRSFVEPIAWSFGVTLVPHRRPPVLGVENVRFPVRMNSVAWRGPTDRLKARQGWMEGPLLGIQTRSEVNFVPGGDDGANSAQNLAVLDVVRELGGMLLLAQERARQGKTEVRSGEGKWWTEKPRWGGGSGGEVGEATGASDASPQDLGLKVDEKEKSFSSLGSRLGLGLKERKRPTPTEMWEVLRPGNPIWDQKIVYEAIGRERGDSEWDDIFLVSSLNHHISLVRLRIHSAYIEHLTSGTLPSPPPTDPQWCSPVLQRTRWYDLFRVEDRTEIMRGIWGLLEYLMREVSDEEGDVDVLMEDGR